MRKALELTLHSDTVDVVYMLMRQRNTFSANHFMLKESDCPTMRWPEQLQHTNKDAELYITGMGLTRTRIGLVHITGFEKDSTGKYVSFNVLDFDEETYLNLPSPLVRAEIMIDKTEQEGGD